MLRDQEILERLEKLVQTERKITAEIVEYIRHVEIRKLYLELGCSSMFQYLTEKLGYTAACAQRRLDASRMLHEIPEIKEELKTGSLNLSQVALVAKGVRQKEKTVQVSKEDKRLLLEQVKHQTLEQTEKTVNSALGIELKEPEKERLRSEGVRLEITLSYEQMEELKRVRELRSHIDPHASWAEIIADLARFYREKKSTSVAEVKSKGAKRRFVFQRDQVCQHRNPDGRVCGSRWQLEIDHKMPRWAGGGDEVDNYQVLCGVHNREKYRRQAGIRCWS